MTTQKLVSKGFEFDDAADAVEFYFERGWADGLPVVPPTDDTVRRFLDEAGRAPSDIVATEPTRGRVITAEKVAINVVMAGCLPEYMPVVLAAIEAMDQPKFNLHAITARTMGAAVLTVVNGPVAGRLGMNSGVNVFGPGCRPNATIGRAIRLVLTNVSGASPGELDKATLGHPGKYSFCIAEAEDVSPWSPLHVERGDPLLRCPHGLFRSSFVDLVFAFRGVSQHSHIVGQDFHEAAGDDDRLFLAIDAKPHLARDQRRHQSRMRRQNCEFAIRPRRGDVVDAARKRLAFGGHYVETHSGHNGFSNS